MEVKLIACDGCWKLHKMPDDTWPFDDIFTAIVIPMRCSPISVDLKTTTRCYTYQGRDDHGMYQYREVYNG